MEQKNIYSFFFYHIKSSWGPLKGLDSQIRNRQFISSLCWTVHVILCNLCLIMWIVNTSAPMSQCHSLVQQSKDQKWFSQNGTGPH